MRCTKCEFENPVGMKFCGQCTAPLQGDMGSTNPKSNQAELGATVRVVTEEAAPMPPDHSLGLDHSDRIQNRGKQSAHPDEDQPIDVPEPHPRLSVAAQYDHLLTQDNVFGLDLTGLRHEKASNRSGLFGKFPTQRNRESFSQNGELI